MNMLFQSDFLKSLGWSLLDSLWQMGILWLVYQVIARTVKMTAARRYNLALLSLQGGTFLFFGGIIYRLISGSAIQVSMEKTATAVVQLPKNLIEQLLPFISVAYIMVAAFLLIKIFIQVNQTRMLGREGLSKVHPELRVFVQELSGRMGIKKKVQVYISSLVDAPMTIGYFKPMILLPVAALTGLNMEQTEAVLLHELEHIRRNDYLVNLMVVVSESIFFFNPFARSFIQIIRKERENSCDDTVLNFNYPGDSYATALLILEKNRTGFNPTVLNAFGSNKFLLLNRVQRILTGKQQFRPDYFRTVLGVSILTILSLFGLYQKDQAKMVLRSFAAKDPKILWKENNLLSLTREPSLHLDLQLPEIDLPVAAFEKERIDEQAFQNEYIFAANNSRAMEENAVAMEENAEAMARFASTRETREFSINEPGTPPPPPSLEGMEHPYIPSYSFEFTLVEDTLMPALRKTVTIHEIKAKEALEKAICELEDACKKNEGLEQMLEIDLVKMKSELKKSLEDINWKEIEKQIRIASDQSRSNLQLQGQLQNYQKNRVLHQENLNRMKEKILMDRLNLQEQKKQEVQKKTIVI
jgi:beta-lactamase regulating signal transducer with metallopeptidase domain